MAGQDCISAIEFAMSRIPGHRFHYVSLAARKHGGFMHGLLILHHNPSSVDEHIPNSAIRRL